MGNKPDQVIIRYNAVLKPGLDKKIIKQKHIIEHLKKN
jgi:hypothetical protein